MKNDTRNAFKSWKRSLLGNHPFLMAVLRHGLFDSKSQQELMIAVLQEQSNSGDDHPAEHDRKELRRKALEARQQLKDAKKLAEKLALEELSEAELSNEQFHLLTELNSGLLEKIMVEENKAYGHGEGVKISTKEEAAVFRMSCNSLDVYHQR